MAALWPRGAENGERGIFRIDGEPELCKVCVGASDRRLREVLAERGRLIGLGWTGLE